MDSHIEKNVLLKIFSKIDKYSAHPLYTTINDKIGTYMQLYITPVLTMLCKTRLNSHHIFA